MVVLLACPDTITTAVTVVTNLRTMAMTARIYAAVLATDLVSTKPVRQTATTILGTGLARIRPPQHKAAVRLEGHRDMHF